MKPVQLARFEKPLGTLTAFLSPEHLAPAVIEGTIDEIVAKDARGALFALEGLLRLYRRIEGEPFESLLEQVKALEDVIGAATEETEYLEFARSVEAPAAVIAVLDGHVATARAHLREALLVAPELLARLRAEVETYAWEPEGEDARHVVRAIARELEKNGELDYDPRELQSGIHELRRDLRWFLIYVQALDGLIVLERAREPLKLNCYSYLESHPIALSRFSKVDRNPALGWVSRIPNVNFLAISKIVNELGAIKSFGEAEEALAIAFEQADLDPAVAHALARKSPSYMSDVPRAALWILEELLETNLLRRTAKALKRGLGEQV